MQLRLHLFYKLIQKRQRTYHQDCNMILTANVLIIHAEHVVQSAWILF